MQEKRDIPYSSLTELNFYAYNHGMYYLIMDLLSEGEKLKSSADFRGKREQEEWMRRKFVVINLTSKNRVQKVVGLLSQ